jgi:hypothetical protein
VRCRASVVVAAGTTALGHSRVLTLRAGRRTTVAVPLTPAGRGLLARATGTTTLTASVHARAADDDGTTVVRRLMLRRG